MFQNKIIFLLLLLSLTMFGNCSEEKKDNTALLAALALLGGGTGAAASSNTGATITRNWGTFTDMLDGTVRLVVTAGTFGGQTYTAQTLFYAKCSHGQTYDAGGNTCSVSGATTVKYCNANDQSCNDAGTGLLNGTGTSTAYTACNALNAGAGTYGKTNWRVPTKNELKLLIECNTKTTMPNDSSQCGDGNYSSISSIFPNTPENISYWTATTSAGNTSQAWDVSFGGGYVYDSNKILDKFVRCVSGTP